MNKDQLLEIASRPGVISGIHNYCDRWCERCAFMSRCALGIEEMESEPRCKDLDNEKFWEQLGESFQCMFEMIKENAEKMGIDINEFDQEAEDEMEREREIAKKNPCCKKSRKYYRLTEKWFENNKTAFETKGKKLESDLIMELPGTDPVSDAVSLSDAVEVIQFYQHFINVKLFRACHGALDESFEEEHGFPKDSDGSAKIALISIDRSISAWAVLLKNFPKQEDSILKMLVLLEDLKKNVEKQFPNAWDFIRPGFDEE